MNLILWDLYGEDEFQKVHMSYLRGAAGYLLVVDGTRRETLDKAMVLRQRTEESVGRIPFVLVINKSDLKDEWEIDEATIRQLAESGLTVFESSAKSGLGVEEAFLSLARDIV